MKERAYRSTALLLLLFLVAFWLRVFRLGYQPVWYDEVYSIAVARHSVAEVAGWVYRDNHPALYWFLIYPLVHLLGDAEFVVRFPSALLGTLTVALLYVAGKQMLGSRRVGLLAAVWLAVSPIHVVYSQEARMYALLAFCGLASMVFLYLAITRGGVANWAVFGVMAAATAHSHNYGLLLLGAQDSWALAYVLSRRSRRLVLGLGLSHLVFAALYAPMVPALLTQLQMSVGSTGVATWHDVLDVFKAFGAGFAGFSTPGLTPGYLIRGAATPAVMLTTGLVLLGLLMGGRSSPERGWPLSLAATCFLLPILALYAYSALLHKEIWQVRGFQMALGSFALLVATGLSALRVRLLRWVALLGLLAVAMVNLYPHYFERYKSTVPDAVAALEGQLSDQDVIFVAPDWMWLPFRYYYRGNADAIGGRWQGDKLQFAGVGIDYADLIEPRALETNPSVRKPIVDPGAFDPDKYTRVWTVGHLATPQHVIDLFGQDVVVMHYDLSKRQWRALIYPASYAANPSRLPVAVETPDLMWEGGLRLLGYSLEPSPVVGRESRLTLFWSVDRPQRHGRLLEVRLVDESGEVWLDQATPMLSVLCSVPMIAMGIRSTFPITNWPPGVVVVQDIALNLPADLPPIPYQLSVRVVDGLGGQPLAAAGQDDVVLGNVSVGRPSRPYGPQVVPVSHRVNARFGDIRLLGYDLAEAPPRPGHYLPVWFHWATLRAPVVDYEVRVRLLDRRGAVVAEAAGSPSTAAFPTSSWREGDLVWGNLLIPLPPELQGGHYRLAVSLVDSVTGESLPGRRGWAPWPREWVIVGRAEVAPWPMVTEPPPIPYEAEAVFGEAVRLLGYNLTEDVLPGGAMEVTLYWRVEARLQKSYKVFVHLTDYAENLVAQADGIPGGWLRPTTTWRPGEVIIDSYTLPLPDRLTSGEFHLYVGFYEPDSGVRLPAISDGHPVPDGRVPIGVVTIQRREGKH